MTTSSIQSGGGGDYTTIASFESDTDTTSSPWIGSIDDTSNYDENVTFNGASTATNFIRLEVATPHEGVLSSSFARMVGNGRHLNWTCDHFECYGLQVENSDGSSTVAFRVSGITSGLIDRCLTISDNGKPLNVDGFTASTVDLVERNSIFIDRGTSNPAARHQFNNAGTTFNLDTYFCFYKSGQNGCRVQTDNGTSNWDCKNCISDSGGAGSAYITAGSGTTNVSGSNNIADDTTAESLFTSSFDSVTFTATEPTSGENVWVRNNTNGSEDFRPPDGAENNSFHTPAGNGTPIAGVDVDIDGTDRDDTSPWIGPYEEAALASSFGSRPLTLLGVGA